MAEQGCDLIVTSGGLGPTADDLTAEVVARFAGVEMVLDEAMEARITAIVAGYARRLRFDPEALRVANRKQAMVPAGAETIDPAGTAPGLVVATKRRPGGDRAPGPAARAACDVGAGAGESPVRARCSSAPSSMRAQTVRMFGIPESELAQSLREIGESVDLERLEITTCLRRGEIEVEIRHRDGAERERELLIDGLVERHERFVFSRDGSTIDEQLAALLAAGTGSGSRSRALQGCSRRA